MSSNILEDISTLQASEVFSYLSCPQCAVSLVHINPLETRTVIMGMVIMVMVMIMEVDGDDDGNGDDSSDVDDNG